MKRSILLVLAIIFIMGNFNNVKSQTLISTLPYTDLIYPFGEPNTATYGQTVTVPLIDNILNNFTFWIDDYLNTDFVDFAAYVMEWDGLRATGPILWQSVMQTSSNNGGAGGYEQFTFNTGALSLNPGANYVFFISSSNYFNGLNGTSKVARGTTSYDGGNFVYMNNGSDFSKLTTQNWTQWSAYDLGFEASFSAVPEPSTLALLGAGILGMGLFARSRKRKA